MRVKFIIKRNGKRARFSACKLKHGISSAFVQVFSDATADEVDKFTNQVYQTVKGDLDARGFDCVTAEDLQNITLVAIRTLQPKVADHFLAYAAKRKELRDMQALQHTLHDLTFSSAEDNDIKRENANIDGDTAMGIMLKYGSESAKSFNLSEMISPDIAEAHKAGDIHIHDLDFYSLTETCCQINLAKLFKGGFSTGHGFLREPGDIRSAAALACIAIQSNQNDQHGGQSIPCFDYYLAPYVTKTLVKEIKYCFEDMLEDIYSETAMEVSIDISNEVTHIMNALMQWVSHYLAEGYSLMDASHLNNLAQELTTAADCELLSVSRIMRILKRAIKYTERKVFQAMEALVHNLNTMNSRAG